MHWRFTNKGTTRTPEDSVLLNYSLLNSRSTALSSRIEFIINLYHYKRDKYINEMDIYYLYKKNIYIYGIYHLSHG